MARARARVLSSLSSSSSSVRQSSGFPSLWMVLVLWRTIAITTTILQPTGIVRVGLVTPLAARPRTKEQQPRQWVRNNHPNNGIDTTNSHHHHHHHLDRRQLLSGFFGTVTTAAATVLVPGVASGIDVSSLTVEANPLDVFLGGTYYEDNGDEGSIDGRIARKKYKIIEGLPGDKDRRLLPRDVQDSTKKKKTVDFFGGLDRPVLVKGESTSISSSKDDAFELTGNLYFCNENGSKGCITVDFSPLGGPQQARGYWDEKEQGIRFLDSQKVWSKQ